MKIDNFSGRKFMTICVTLTFCVASLTILFMDDAHNEAKIAVFGALSALATSISKDYFHDRQKGA